MTVTPKSVILAIVMFGGAFALLALGGTVYLIDQGKASGAEIALVSSPMVFVLGALFGILGSPRTTPELPAGGTLTTGTTTLSTPAVGPNPPNPAPSDGAPSSGLSTAQTHADQFAPSADALEVVVPTRWP